SPPTGRDRAAACLRPVGAAGRRGARDLGRSGQERRVAWPGQATGAARNPGAERRGPRGRGCGGGPMRTDEETWLREQLQLDAPPPMRPLDGRMVVHQGRSRRRRQRIAATTPLAAAGALVLGTSLWAAQLLPDSVQEALPAAPSSTAPCPDIAPGEGSLADGSAGTQVTSEVGHLAVLDWVAQDGTKVLVIRTADGCLVPDEQGEGQSSGVGLSVLTQAPGGPLLLHGSRDPGEDVARWGASILQVPG